MQPRDEDRVAGLGGARSPELVAALLTLVADALYLVGPDGRVSFLNPAAVTLLGYESAEELIGADSHATIHHTRPDGSRYPETECPLLRPRVTGETVRVDRDWFIRKDGSLVPVAYSSAPVDLPEGRGAIVVFRDISGQLAYEKAIERETEARTRAAEVAASRRRLVEAQEQERRRLARDLHDGAQARLLHALIAIEGARRALPSDPERASAALAEAHHHARRAIEELREFAAGVHPALLRDRGLGAAVEELAGLAPLPVATRLSDERYPDAIEAAAYFLVAEALTNVAKHAHAREAEVAAMREGPELVVEVRDDGRGGAAAAGGSGLRGLSDRFAALGGRIDVRSPPGSGTVVRGRLPL